MAVCRRDSGVNVSGAMMWLYVGETEDSMVDAMYQEARMWLEVGETEDSMVEAMCNASECGWR